MAYDLTEIQTQVRLLTNASGLDTRVITWTNRVLQDIGQKAWFQQQIAVMHKPTVGGGTNVTSNWETVSGIPGNAVAAAAYDPNLINIHRVVHVQMAATNTYTSVSTYLNPLVRYSIQDLYCHFQAQSINVTGASVNFYAVPQWDEVDTTASTVYPKMVFYPHPKNATYNDGGAFQIWYLQSISKLTSGTDTNWLLKKYFHVVLRGVLRFARLYLGDPQGYLVDKAAYENGVVDILRNEEIASASTPYMRGVMPESLY